MATMFSKTANTLSGAFTVADASLNFGKVDLGALVQSLNFTYAQNITRLYEIAAQIGKANVYYVGGRTQGQASVGRIIGPNSVITALYNQYGDVCKACSNDLVLNLNASNCCTGSNSATAGTSQQGAGSAKKAAMSYTLHGCVMTQVGVSMTAQDMIINEQSQIMFVNLDYSPDNG